MAGYPRGERGGGEVLHRAGGRSPLRVPGGRLGLKEPRPWLAGAGLEGGGPQDEGTCLGDATPGHGSGAAATRYKTDMLAPARATTKLASTAQWFTTRQPSRGHRRRTNGWVGAGAFSVFPALLSPLATPSVACGGVRGRGRQTPRSQPSRSKLLAASATQRPA